MTSHRRTRLLGAVALAAALGALGCASESASRQTSGTPAQRTEAAMAEAFDSGALSCAAIEADPTPEAMARVTIDALAPWLAADDVDASTVGRVYRNECQ